MHALSIVLDCLGRGHCMNSFSQRAQGHTRLIASLSVSMEGVSSMTMTPWCSESCLPKKKLWQWVATKLATRKGVQGRNSKVC